MRAQSAVDLIAQLTYRPGWEIRAECYDRFEQGVCVTVEYEALNSARELAAHGFTERIRTAAQFPLLAGDLDELGLYRAVAGLISVVDEHEMREWLRVKPTWWAPFHPHRCDGIRRWAEMPAPDPPARDLLFGLT